MTDVSLEPGHTRAFACALDHVWEIEDRDPVGGPPPQTT